MNNLLLGLVPERIRARANGYSFLLYDTSWTLDRNITINLADIHHYLSDGTLDGCLRTLAFYASNRSSSHTKNILERFQHMLRETDAREITDTVLINYRSMLSPATEWYLATIRGLRR
ncbi:hypothetical protein NXZ01_24090 [Escherichia coli]|nr:hypothetical protein [Escherichia coli]